MNDSENPNISVAASLLGGPFLGYAVAGWAGYLLAFAVIALIFGAYQQMSDRHASADTPERLTCGTESIRPSGPRL